MSTTHPIGPRPSGLSLNPMAATQWTPPPDWTRVLTLDAHTAGEPFRIVLEPWFHLPGNSIAAKRRYAETHLEAIRRAIMWEPRGHADMYGCVLTEPTTPGADCGILFLHNGGFSTMCGHGIIAMATAAVETGMVPAVEPETAIGIDTPAGLIRAWARVGEGRVLSVRFRNVASFVHAYDRQVSVEHLGTVRCDIAFGGAYYAFVDADSLGLTLNRHHARSLVDAGMAIKKAVMTSTTFDHPGDSSLGFLYGTIFTASPEDPDCHSRHVCVFADGEVDRSPTGTGVSARLALLHGRGEIGTSEPIVIESILGTRFAGQVAEETSAGPYTAIIPEVSGQAAIIGRGEHWIDPNDPVGNGFLIR